ncbi:MAG: hypothetical protein P8127_05010 [Acidobacteriota bacterium]
MKTCDYGWESLRGDPLPWLLDARQPNIQWKALSELVKRPLDSPAVNRARGGANVAEPLASMLEGLQPDGSWVDDPPIWRPYSGSGWRLLAAVQWGADPNDPRLQGAARALLESAPGEGGFSLRRGKPPLPWLTARLLQGLAELRWCHHPRFQEALAWLEEGDGIRAGAGWRVIGRRSKLGECAVTAAALLEALASCADRPRRKLEDRATASIVSVLGETIGELARLGHPCLRRTDEAELLWALSRAGSSLDGGIVGALKRVQHRQLEGGVWRRDVAVPQSLAVTEFREPGGPSRWVTLKCVTALMTYAVEARLPRMYPQKPD